MKTIYLIDAYSFIYRAYYIAPDLTNPEGFAIGAVFIYLKMLLKLLREHKMDLAVIALDHPSTTLRKQIYPDYKANRGRSKDVKQQLALAREASRALGLMNIESPGYEADDIIATLAKRAETEGMKVVIVSPDKDLMQLVNEQITVFEPMNEKYIDANGVKEKFGVPPKLLADYLAMIGDISDNIPGIPKVGGKTAVKLLRQFGNLETVLKSTNQLPDSVVTRSIADNVDKALLSRSLIELYINAPIDIEFEDMKVLYNRDTVRDFCEKHDFKSLMNTI